MENKEMITPFFWMTEPSVLNQKQDHKEFINPDDIPWTEWLMPGTYFKLLFCDIANGAFTIIMKVDPGTTASVHWHLGSAQAYILEGNFYYDKDDVGNTKNCYTCEIGGAVHQPYSPDGCIMLAFSQGPIAGYHEGKMVLVADAQLHFDLAKQNNAIKNATVVGYTHLPQKDEA